MSFETDATQIPDKFGESTVTIGVADEGVALMIDGEPRFIFSADELVEGVVRAFQPSLKRNLSPEETRLRLEHLNHQAKDENF